MGEGVSQRMSERGICVGACGKWVGRRGWSGKSIHARTKISIILFYEFTRSGEC